MVTRLASVLPNESEYHQLQREQLLLTPHKAPRPATDAVDLEHPPDLTARAELVRQVKTSLDEPLTSDTETRSWWPTYVLVGLAIGWTAVLVLIVWYLFG